MFHQYLKAIKDIHSIDNKKVNMSLNTLPPEILERIFESVGDDYCAWYSQINNKLYQKRFALVCRKWARIAIPIIWKDVKVSGLGRRNKANSFKFYRHIIAHSCGQYTRKLVLKDVSFWAICIEKILQACPYIQIFKLKSYHDNSNKGSIDLDSIMRALPNLRKLDISGSHIYFGEEATQKLIDTQKKLTIRATKQCIKDPNNVTWKKDKYKNGKWSCEH